MCIGVMNDKYMWRVTSGNYGFRIGEAVQLGRYPTKIQFMDSVDVLQKADPVMFRLEYNPDYTEVEVVDTRIDLKYRFSLVQS